MFFLSYSVRRRKKIFLNVYMSQKQDTDHDSRVVRRPGIGFESRTLEWAGEERTDGIRGTFVRVLQAWVNGSWRKGVDLLECCILLRHHLHHHRWVMIFGQIFGNLYGVFCLILFKLKQLLFGLYNYMYTIYISLKHKAMKIYFWFIIYAKRGGRDN